MVRYNYRFAPLQQSLAAETLLDIVQALVKDLELKNISLLGHSSGAIYVLNTILHLRHLLHPKRPYAAIFTPWVHPSRSKVVTPTIGRFLPSWAIRRWYDFSYFTTRHYRAILGPSTARPGVKMVQNDGETRAVDERIMEYALLENVEGVSQEALFCVKRGSDNMWGWRDYDVVIPMLKEREVREGGGRGERLTLDVFFAESDHSSGKKGAEWFDKCWKTSLEDGGWVDYHSRTMPGTNHETIMRVGFGAIEAVFETIAVVMRS